MKNNTIQEHLQKHFAEKIVIDKAEDTYLEVTVDPSVFLQAAEFFKKMGFGSLSDISSVDYKDHFLVVYQLFSFTENNHVCLQVRLDDYQNPQIDSLYSLWKTADWHEREVYDLMGIRFVNHPNLKRILMWEGYEGHPLRKDFIHPERKRSWEE